jgi:hypothetical protein
VVQTDVKLERIYRAQLNHRIVVVTADRQDRMQKDSHRIVMLDDGYSQ